MKYFQQNSLIIENIYSKAFEYQKFLTYVCTLMANYLVRFLVSLSILISSGYSAVYANQANENAKDEYGSLFANSIGVNNSSQHPLTFSAANDHGNDIFIVNNSKVEEEDDDFVSSNVLDFQYFSALQFTQVFVFLSNDLSEDLPFSKFTPNTPTLRLHVLFQVFRL
ncbi:hypothetical protein LV84_04010 [Algoriphagus ratkowskyi]|uniref:Uncharacterized protein n=1 Tax=Algoriphagus ratkowskyi TaxID=57028 RepID=A0A2W7QPG3_9BACT|nr:hypothetical protein [Algoriphagus ratkowskyi]PZX50448.1 hypothetical protein LV84_04010 [Algoriphagus ratkowskyi]TXD75740.1 hypothetical protein ESW18_19495 [Algoriphagus ratkowskyi]